MLMAKGIALDTHSFIEYSAIQVFIALCISIYSHSAIRAGTQGNNKCMQWCIKNNKSDVQSMSPHRKQLDQKYDRGG